MYESNPLPIPNTSVTSPAPIACEGERPTIIIKKGLKKRAPETPDDKAIREKIIDDGKIHQ